MNTHDLLQDLLDELREMSFWKENEDGSSIKVLDFEEVEELIYTKLDELENE